MANKIISNSMETIEGIAKAAQRGMGDMAQDAKQSVTGDTATETAAPKTISDPQKQQIKSADNANLQAARRNLDLINQQMAQIRKGRERTEVQQKHQQNEEKKFEKKKKESVLEKTIKAQQGSKEISKVAG